MAYLVGQKVGPYRLVRRIGSGGFGEVYEATQRLSNVRWAVKILPVQDPNAPTQPWGGPNDPDAGGLRPEQVEREVRAQSVLSHPHIVLLSDWGFYKDADTGEYGAYLAMPLIEGGTLKDVLNQAARRRAPQLPLEQIFYYLRQISPALDYAHTQNVAHFDLKPGNLLVNTEGLVFLADFGLARLLNGDLVQGGGTSLRAGTPYYMPPEQCNGNPVRVSDVYALGVIVFQMLTGQAPFTGDAGQVIDKHRYAPVPAVRALRPALPPTVERVMQKVLCKDPNQRYQTAAAFEADLLAACPPQMPVPAIPHRPYGYVSSSTKPILRRNPLANVFAAVGRALNAVRQPRMDFLKTFRAINWSTLGFKNTKRWFPRVVANLPPLLFAADVLVLPLVVGLWFHSWWALAGALLPPLLALTFAVIGTESKNRSAAVLGALLCGVLWGVVGWGVGAIVKTPPLSFAAALLAFGVFARFHIEAFPVKALFINKQTEHRYWRWWVLCAVDGLVLPLVLGVALHRADIFGMTALAATGTCLLFGAVGEQKNRAFLWGLAVLLLTCLWAGAGWVLCLSAPGAQLTLVSLRVPVASALGAGAGALSGFMVHRFLLGRVFRSKTVWVGALLAADIANLPVVLGVWRSSWQLFVLALGIAAALYWLARRGYRRPGGRSSPKYLPVVFGIFLASVSWAAAGWGIGLLFPMKHFSFLVSGLLVQGTWLSVGLALLGFFASSPRHLRLFQLPPPSRRSKYNSKTIRIWLVCLYDLFILPLLLYLALRQQWVIGLSLAGAGTALAGAVLIDLWEEPFARFVGAAASALEWAITGWVLGLLLPAIPGVSDISVHVGAWVVAGTWVALGTGVAAFVLGLLLHRANFTR